MTNRLQKQLDAAQQKEQVGFQSGFTTIDHIYTIREIIESFNEYELPLCVAFADNEKAFDSVSSLAVMDALRSSNIDPGYIHHIENIRSNNQIKTLQNECIPNQKINKTRRRNFT